MGEGLSKAVDRQKPIEANLEDLKNQLIEMNDQLSRLQRSIDRIQPIEEEKSDRTPDSKERDFNSMSIHDRICFIGEKMNINYRRLSYLNEKLDERV